MELVAKLGIDLKLLLAQVVNFGLLAFLLHRFAYKPVLEMLDKRQKKIEQGMKDSEKSEQLLKEIEETRVAALQKIKEQSLELFEKAAQDAEASRQELLKKAQEEIHRLHEKAAAALVEEKRKMLQEVRSEVVELALLAAERVIGRAIQPEDQKRIVNELVSAAKHR